nr:uncharacterized protein LOC124819011 [Hydra vulgaris]
MLLKVGDCFNSLQELEQKVSSYGIESCVSLYKRESRTIESARRRGIKRFIKESLMFYTIHYACYHGGKNFISKSTGKRPNQSTFQMNCTFGIWFKVTDDGMQFCVDKMMLEHNHDIDREFFNNLPKRRKLSTEAEQDVSRILTMHGNKWLIKDQILKETGLKKLIILQKYFKIVCSIFDHVYSMYIIILYL